jgi:hypothetical protein
MNSANIDKMLVILIKVLSMWPANYLILLFSQVEYRVRKNSH